MHSDDPSVGLTEFWKSSTVASASEALARAEFAKIKTADDFNRDQEAAVAKKKEEEAKAEKEPVMSNDGKYMCANKGCADKSFKLEENNDAACKFHKGEAIFHDVKKYWSCCTDKPAYDFDA
ncbi:MAG: hypothetical protein ACK55Z_19930, partial [bacterium]